eukprot:CAMPEP_0183341146 /NCGR_PEP_ID=MMETSP0164_2-20130417/7442_1 /TAXON_ID=221442 /ORGANISM="Coccolithus pelagicus ssp braarudi, Strain PLY182g" /LENGTH=52 /DNA_ID=CAMNT_0025511381 /DNA_START=374 /DNA_END=532 /DNA_ORIENTATION=-
MAVPRAKSDPESIGRGKRGDTASITEWTRCILCAFSKLVTNVLSDGLKPCAP